MEIVGVFSIPLQVALTQILQPLSQPVMVSGCGGVIRLVTDGVELIQFEGEASKSSCPQIGVAICRDRFSGEKMFSIYGEKYPLLTFSFSDWLSAYSQHPQLQ